MTEEDILEEFIKKEDEFGLNDVRYMDIPLWRLFRTEYRNRYIAAHLKNFAQQTAKRNIVLWLCYSVFFSILSVCKIVKILLCKKRYENIVFAFSRLQKLNGVYIDKFTDPVIDRTDIGKSVCVFQFINRKVYIGKRWKANRVTRMESIVYFSSLLSLFLWPIMFASIRKEIIRLYDKVKLIFYLKSLDTIKWCIKLTFFKCEVILYRFIFKRTKCKRIYVVNRIVCLPQIVAAHQCGLLALEFQHGITMGSTILYSGHYDAAVDPDYFLTFGKAWEGNQFTIPLDRVINIGWAYKEVLKTLSMSEIFYPNACLVVSSPEITGKLVNIVLLLANEFPDMDFHIRCHPQESLQHKYLEKIEAVSNVKVADNTIDSFMALRTYSYVIGENSSVLFEALSMGKMVARLSFKDFNPISTHIENDGFYYIHELNDFLIFFDGKGTMTETGFYNEFNPEIINSLF